MSENNTYGRVLLINGSPHKEGSTYRALCEVKTTLEAEGIECELVNVGKMIVPGCQGCYACGKLGKCAIDDIVNELAEKFKEADGIIVGSPVHYASPAGALVAILDRLFYSSRFDKSMKIGAAVVSARRAGTTASFDVLNKYFTISGMPVVPSNYWNNVHGNSATDCECDGEGLQCMRTLARNAAFLIKSIKLGVKEYGLPQREKKIRTDFIR